MQFVTAAATDPGLRKSHNEDAYLMDPDRGIFAVADGMGGHNAGEVASRMLIDEIRRQRDAISRALETLAQAPTGEGRRRFVEFLPTVIEHANRLVHAEALRDRRKRGMGTTVVLLVAAGLDAFVCHVGDSRLYLLRNGELILLTQDHCRATLHRQRARFPWQKAAARPRGRGILRAVGVHPEVQVDTLYLDLVPGDRFLLCTDGLSDLLRRQQLEDLMRRYRGEDLVRRAIVAANHAGGRDNVTAAMVEVLGERSRLGAARMEMMERLAFLGGLSMFADLDQQERIKVNRIVHERRYQDGEVIIRAGDWGGEIFIVVEGEVGVWRGRTPLVTLRDGGHFGELGALSQERRSATVRANGACRLLCIDQDDFLRLACHDPRLGNKVLLATVRHLAERVQDLTARVPVSTVDEE